MELSKNARMRLKWLKYAVEHNGNVSQTCRHFDIQRSTFYKWANAFNPDDPRSLEDQSSAPKNVRQPETDAHVVSLIREYRGRWPLLGKDEMRKRLQEEHGISISASTIGRTIRRNGFFFADTEFHRKKRLNAQRAHREDSVESTQSEVTGKLHDVMHKDTDHKSSGSTTLGMLVLLLATGIAATFAPTVNAVSATSTDYVLDYGTLDAGAVPATSSDFKVTGGTTSFGALGSASNIKLVPLSATPAVARDTTDTDTTDTTTQISGGGRGGRGAEGRGWEIGPPKTYGAAPSDQEVQPESLSAPEIPAGSSDESAWITAPATSEVEKQVSRPTTPETTREEIFSEEAIVFTFVGMHESAPPEAPAPTTLSKIIVLIPILIILLLTIYMVWILGFAAAGTFAIVALFITVPLHALADSTPNLLNYDGRLLNSSNAAITTAQDFRFSIWSNQDNQSGDITGTGAINIGAANYGGWYEEQTVTPNSQGAFSVVLGSSTTLPVVQFSSGKYLQVEVRTSGGEDTEYQVLDPDSSSSTIDRMTIGSNLYAENAERLHNRSVGTGSGNILLLQSGAALSIGGNFTINDDNEGADAVLTFGNIIAAETLKFLSSEHRFEFSDDVHVTGNLTASGGLTIESASRIKANLDIAGTASGRTLFAMDTLASSGNLIVDGNAESRGTISGAYLDVSQNISASGTLSVEGTSVLQNNLDVVGTMSGTSLQVTGTGSAPIIYTDQTNGRVGIGTVSPSANLHIYQDSPTVNQTLFRIGTNDSASRFTVDEDGDVRAEGGAEFYQHFYMHTTKLFYLDDGYDTYFSETSADNVQFTTGGTERLRINNTGIGVGTASPSTKLEVVGTASGRTLFAMDTLASSGNLIVDGDAESRGTMSGAHLDVSQNISASGTLMVEGNMTTAGTLSGANLTFMSGANSYVLGNFGIGVNDPSAKLTVSGTVKIDNTGLSTHDLTISNTDVVVGAFNTNVVTFTNNTDDRVNNPEFIFNSEATGGDGAWNLVEFQDKGVSKFSLTNLGGVAFQDDVSVVGTYRGRNSAGNLNTYFGQVGTASANVGGIFAANTDADEQVLAYSWSMSSGADTDVWIPNSLRFSLRNDNAKFQVGAADDASVYYDGTNMIIDPKEVGSGYLQILGTASGLTLHAADTLSSSGNLIVDGDAEARGILSGASLHVSGATTMSGTVKVQNATDSTTSFQVKDADGGTPILNVDTTNERVGIGTATPSFAFEVDVAHSSVARFSSTVYSGSKEIFEVDAHNQDNVLAVRNYSGNGNLPMVKLQSTQVNRLVVSGTDNPVNEWGGEGTAYIEGLVGIGTTSPSTKLEVVGTASGRTLFAQDTLASSGNLIVDGNAEARGTLSGASLHVSGATTMSGTVKVQNATDSTTSFQVKDADGGTPILNVDTTNERVGIGTASPGYALAVDGVIQGQATDLSGDVLRIGNDSKLVDVDASHTAGIYSITDTTVGALTLGSSNNTLITSVANADSYFSNGGDVGIGTKTPNDKLAIWDATDRGTPSTYSTSNGDQLILTQYYQDTGYSYDRYADIVASRAETNGGSVMRFFTKSDDVTSIDERMRITADGNIGIDTTTPGSKLSVSGSVIIGDNLGSSETETGISLEVVGTASGRTLFAQDTLASSGNLIVDGNAEVRGTLSGANLTVMSGASSYMLGDLGIGTTNPESRLQVSGGGLCVGSDANCNTDNDTEGIVYSSSTEMTAYDLAEMYPTKDTSIHSGEIVSLDLDNGVFVKRAKEGDKKLIGVISTDPGALLGGFVGKQFKDEHQVAVALSGRVPVHVTTENGDIAIGDYLTISSQPGIARKANDGEQAIGYALEPFPSEDAPLRPAKRDSAGQVGDIQVFIQLERAISDVAAISFEANGSILSVAEGTITVVGNFHLLTTQDRAEEDVLAVINGGKPQQTLVLRKLSDQQSITVRRSGRLLLKEDFVFEDSDDTLVLMHIGNDVWVELARTGQDVTLNTTSPR